MTNLTGKKIFTRLPSKCVLSEPRCVTFFLRTRIKYSKTCLERPLIKYQKLAFKTDNRLMHVKSIAECSKRAFCNTSDLH